MNEFVAAGGLQISIKHSQLLRTRYKQPDALHILLHNDEFPGKIFDESSYTLHIIGPM